jgi:bZIP transcription factor
MFTKTRLCRLLRNRVSAQQARERKKQYVHELEQKVADKDEQIQRLTSDLKKAATTNATLRRLILTMRTGSGSGEQPHALPSTGTAGVSASHAATSRAEQQPYASRPRLSDSCMMPSQSQPLQVLAQPGQVGQYAQVMHPQSQAASPVYAHAMAPPEQMAPPQRRMAPSAMQPQATSRWGSGSLATPGSLELDSVQPHGVSGEWSDLQVPGL